MRRTAARARASGPGKRAADRPDRRGGGAHGAFLAGGSAHGRLAESGRVGARPRATRPVAGARFPNSAARDIPPLAAIGDGRFTEINTAGMEGGMDGEEIAEIGRACEAEAGGGGGQGGPSQGNPRVRGSLGARALHSAGGWEEEGVAHGFGTWRRDGIRRLGV